MSNLRVVLKHRGVRQMLKSEEMAALLSERAQNAVSSLGEGYETTTYIGKNRANADIRATTYKAYKETLENNTIIKALR